MSADITPGRKECYMASYCRENKPICATMAKSQGDNPMVGGMVLTKHDLADGALNMAVVAENEAGDCPPDIREQVLAAYSRARDEVVAG